MTMLRFVAGLVLFLVIVVGVTSCGGPVQDVGVNSSYQEYAESGGLREIIPGRYVFTRWDNVTFNSGVIVTDNGVIVLDSLLNEDVASGVRQSISKVTNQPVRVLVSSTFHEFFSGGVAAYSDALNIGHEEYQRHLIEALADKDESVLEGRLPDQVYRERVTLYIGGKELQILHLGRGHTRGDSVVFIPSERMVYMSELYSHREFPSLTDSYVNDWIKALDVAGEMEVDIFVPGHGLITEDPRASREGMQEFQALLIELRDAVQVALEDGMAEEEAVNEIELPRYEDWLGYERGLPGAVRRIYQELTVGLD